ncbi:MAG: 3D domain-containing protein [Pyrinomonadaceae bacterium]
MKSLLGGSAALTVALLASSLLFNPRPLVAEPNSALQNQTAQQKNASVLVASAASAEDSNVAGISTAEDSLEDVAATLDKAIVAPSSGGIISSRTDEMMRATSVASPAQSFVATAYSLSGRTASGLPVSKGIIAADRTLLPLGSRVRIDAGTYSGEYLVADTGGGVRGRRIDVWMPSSREACRFGRRSVRLTVLSYGGKRAPSRVRK